jgi:Tfp pilus assembly protein PilF
MAEGYERSRQMAEKALAIAPDLVEALLALADIQLEYDWDMEAAERSYRRALEIRPSDAEGLRTYGYFLIADGRYEEAVKYYRKAIEVDPLQVRAYYGLAGALVLAGQYDGIPELTERLAQQKDDGFMEKWRKNVELMELRQRRQYREMIPLLPDEPETFGDLADAAISRYHGGDPQKAQEYLQKLIEIANENSARFTVVASVLAQMGQPDLAIEYLEKGLENHEVVFGFIRTDSDLEPLRHDPRFLDILKRAGLKPPPSK